MSQHITLLRKGEDPYINKCGFLWEYLYNIINVWDVEISDIYNSTIVEIRRKICSK